MTGEIMTLSLALGFAAVLSLAASLPAMAAPAMLDPVAVQVAASNDVLQVRSRGYRRWYGYARNAYGSRRNRFDCLGRRDSSGVPC
jgi:hypothetical protein